MSDPRPTPRPRPADGGPTDPAGPAPRSRSQPSARPEEPPARTPRPPEATRPRRAAPPAANPRGGRPSGGAIPSWGGDAAAANDAAREALVRLAVLIGIGCVAIGVGVGVVLSNLALAALACVVWIVAMVLSFRKDRMQGPRR